MLVGGGLVSGGAATVLLATTTVAAPGSVVAPDWFLPTSAAFVGLLPLCIIPLARGAEADKRSWEQVAPEQVDGYAAMNPDAFFVDDSGPKGQGLFATCHVRKGTFLFDYTGELLSELEYNARYPTRVSDYTAALREPDPGIMHFVDGRDERAGHPSRWMNHDGKQPNVGRRSFFPRDGSPPRILMYALRDLRPGDELQWDYGDGYWKARSGLVE
jgi:hypothetical protein